MMKVKISLTIICIIFCGIFSHNLFAGDKIKLKLHQPPPNKMPVSSLWAMDIENTTKEDVTIYLFGTVNGDRQGEIVGGTSKPFNVKPGKKTYGYEDFKSGEVKWVNKSIQEIIIRTGEVPDDNYTICVTAYYEDGNVALQQQCIMQLIIRGSEGIITLISPSDNEELKSENPINFIWTGTGLKGPYTLQIVEVRKGQSTEQAFSENKEFYTNDKITVTSFRCPPNAPLFIAEKKYAWRVRAGESFSDIQSFKINSNNAYPTLEFTPEQCPPGCCFKMSISGNNTYPTNGFKVISGSNSIISVNLLTGFSIINQSSGEASIRKDNGQFVPGTEIGTICFLQIDNSIPVKILWSTNSGETYDLNHPDDVTLACPCPTCSCPRGVHFAPLIVTIGDKEPITINCGVSIAKPIPAGISVTVNTSYTCPTGCLSPPLYFCGITNTSTGERLPADPNFPFTFIAPPEGAYAFGIGVHCSYSTGPCDTCVVRFNTTCRTDSLTISTGYKFSLNNTLQIGDQDGLWNAFVVPSSGWAGPLGNSQWISPNISRHFQSQDYSLSYSFCIENLDIPPKLELDYMVDNSASIILNNNPISGSDAINNFLGPSKNVIINDPDLFKQGRNNLTILIHNDLNNGNPTFTGLNLKGTVTGNLLLPTCPCCLCGNWNAEIPKPIILSFNNQTELLLQRGASYNFPSSKSIIAVSIRPLAYNCNENQPPDPDCLVRYTWVIRRKKKNSSSWQNVKSGNGSTAAYNFNRTRKYKVVFTAWCGVDNCGTCDVTLGNAP